MHKINEVARNLNVAVFIVAHYRNTTGEIYGKRPDSSRFRDAAAIKQVANVIIQIQRNHEDEEDPSLFFFTKIR